MMSCCCEGMEKGLHYVSPAHGGWGVIRVAALVPESYQLFVTPFACGRHGALGGAINGVKDRISYFYLEEGDIVSGDYEKLIPDAVDELLEALEKRPKALLIFVSCLDDLLGTDHEPILQELQERHGDIAFRVCHMNPISLEGTYPPVVTLQMNMYSFLKEGQEKKKQVNLLGCNVLPNQDCELFGLLENHGYELLHISQFDDFTKFQRMGASAMNMVLTPAAVQASLALEKRLEIPALTSFVTYDVEEIMSLYEVLEVILDLDISVLEERKEAVLSKIQATRDLVGDCRIAIDYQATVKPLTLAKMLLQNGFHVTMVFINDVSSFEKEVYQWILANAKDVQIINCRHHDIVKMEFIDKDALSIGLECGYYTQSERVAPLLEDEGMFGLYGVERLMDMLSEAYLKNNRDTKELIEEAGFII